MAEYIILRKKSLNPPQYFRKDNIASDVYMWHSEKLYATRYATRDEALKAIDWHNLKLKNSDEHEVFTCEAYERTKYRVAELRWNKDHYDKYYVNLGDKAAASGDIRTYRDITYTTSKKEAFVYDDVRVHDVGCHLSYKHENDENRYNILFEAAVND